MGRATAPEVRLENTFRMPYDNAVAAARTCYSSRGIITPEDVVGANLLDPAARERRVAMRDRIASSVYQAGHHTTIQHAHFQFALSGVSRQFIWSFLHAHPFYNSEQVSQRYVTVRPGSFYVPDLPPAALAIYEATIGAQMSAYQRLCELLAPRVEAAYLEIFPGRRGKKRTSRDVPKRGQEIARYVLPVATMAYLYHTISAITLMRYQRLCRSFDVPHETALVVRQMVDAVLDVDPDMSKLFEESMPLEETPEHAAFTRFHGDRPDPAGIAEMVAEFDAQLDGRTSILVGRKPENVRLVADAVREVLGLPSHALDDADATRLAVSPAHNRYLGEALNLSTHSKLMRCLHHAHYTFRKKLSHTADSQDQRHRTTPGSRPIVAAHLSETPDVITPQLVREVPEAASLYADTMDRTWEGINQLRDMDVSAELVQYLLPNAAAIRFTESADLLGLRHKMAMRLCYNAQEEIWRASLDEAIAIADVEPELGRYLLPPCNLRHSAGLRPICPEGDRFCGVTVWKLDRTAYERLL